LVYASAPVSIVIIGAGALAWGLGGGDISNAVGEGIEYGTFESDSLLDAMEYTADKLEKVVESW